MISDDVFACIPKDRYVTSSELERMTGIDSKFISSHVKNGAKRANRAIRIKTSGSGRSVTLSYRVSDLPYQDDYICDDEPVESTITMREFINATCKFSNNRHNLAKVLFNHRQRYLTYDQIAEYSGVKRNQVCSIISDFESGGLHFHRRKPLMQREVKLISYNKVQPGAADVKEEDSDAMKLINEVFRC